MLRLVAYDISDPKRLRRICEICEYHGSRVQKSIFECWLEGERFERFWDELSAAIDKEQDSLIAYTMDAKAAEARRKAGEGTVLTEKRGHLIL